jgi:formamidopyrimidine-DNA glycosylase
MPELPEVETLRRELNGAIKNKTIGSAEIKVYKMVKPLTPANFQQKIKNKKILGIDRRAKVLVFELSAGLFLLIHLKMSGQLIFAPNRLKAKGHKLVVGGHPHPGGLDNLPNKFTHAIFTFSDGSKLYFNDLRKFGWIKLASKEGLEKLSNEFGPEPLEKEFTLKKFKEILNKYPKRKIKQVLMDQSLIAGIGNIYADESCFCSGILPTRIVKNIKPKEAEKLYRCMIKILKFAISKKGTSANTYIQLDGSKGGMKPYLKVYGRKGEKCKKCGGTIQKIKLNGRGTHFCRKCQN